MTTRPTYSLQAYMHVLKISQQKRLLVEGDTDRRFFTELLDKLFIGHQVRVDVIDRAVTVEGLGNRKRVEHVCEHIVGKWYADRLTGFVDREFDDFEIGEAIYDTIRTHKVQERLVWSRGHSVENYFFDSDKDTHL